ncbi:hypothetical protein CYMTET_19135 [Cymbomonas tetramitiformis]|uniref:Uncharacterized protein n=1 Tax=Cymbomonas tetramitiformis TaxID=36881 RepID=A0AAE0G6M5_9CHLO|nr:hypothetical protein CYMTET_19135 [Cymbomonas tetramitiformis]
MSMMYANYIPAGRRVVSKRKPSTPLFLPGSQPAIKVAYNALQQPRTSSRVLQRWTPKPSVFHHHRTSLSAVNRFDGVEYASADKFKFALLFDCDGVIVETEELHRQAYNGAFEAFELKIDDKPVNWSVEYYEKLQNTVGGGKPKMKYHFNTTVNVANLLGGVWPESNLGAAPNTPEAKDALIDALQDKKTEIYKVIVEEVATARPGVLELMDEGLARDDIAMGICSAATLAGFEKVVNSVVGKERLAKFDVILAGDQGLGHTHPIEGMGTPSAKSVSSVCDDCCGPFYGSWKDELVLRVQLAIALQAVALRLPLHLDVHVVDV